jgi:hypothetical protein
VDADKFLRLWQEVHGELDDRQRRSFLRRPELQLLVRFPDRAVLSAAGRAPKLARIAELAAKESWWHDGAPCEQDNLAWCSRCKPHPYPSVVVMTTGRSSAFHRSDDCAWLAKGQTNVTRKGGEAAMLEKVPVQVALGSGRVPCLACFPPDP